MEPLTWPALFFAAGSCQCLDRGQVCCSEAHRGRPEPASRQAVEQPSRRLVNRHTVNFIKRFFISSAWNLKLHN